MTSNKPALDTFPKLLLRNANTYAQSPAIREKKRGIWRTESWAGFAGQVAKLANALSKRGLERGNYVAFIGDNRPRLYMGMCAAQSLGAIAVPLYQDASGAELLPLIQKTAPTHVFAENQEQVDKLIEILPQCPSISTIIYDEDRGMRHYDRRELVSYTQLLEAGKDGSEAQLKASADQGSGADIAFVFFTSGATGDAKGVCLSYDALIDRARVMIQSESLTHEDVTMAYLPPGWIGQCLFSYVQPMVAGSSVCCPESSDTLLSDLREIAPTFLLATPRVLDTISSQIAMRIEDAGGMNARLYRKAMKQANAGNSSWFYNTTVFGPLRDTLGMTRMKVAFCAGDAIDPAMLSFFQAVGVNLKQLYGSTETGYCTSMHQNGDVKSDTVGKPVEGVELSFSDQGEILVRSPGLFAGYLDDPKKTTLVKNDDGWFHSGDIGHLGDDGHLRVTDRAADIGTLKDGTKFVPRPLENKLKFDPYIREAVIIGDGRDNVCALIDIAAGAVGQWADANNVTYSGHVDLATQEVVGDLILERLKMINADLAKHTETQNTLIQRFVLLPAELNANDGLLTRTGRLKRGAIFERFGALISALYSDQTKFGFDTGSGEITEITLFDVLDPAIDEKRVA